MFIDTEERTGPGLVIRAGTLACEKLTGLLMAPGLVKDMEKVSCTYQTSSIEAFHSLILKFASKNVAFSFMGMLCRYECSF